MAIAQRFLADRYNRPHHEIVDSWIYAICSDGDMMEGISSEAASIAGHLGLGRLVYVYDDNHITIDGTTSLTFTTEDKGKRFEAYGWHVQHVDDSEDLDALLGALAAAKAEEERPSLIVLRSHIAYPAPHAVDTGEGARLSARRGRGPGDEGGHGLRSRRDLRRLGRGARAHGGRRRAGRRAAARVGRAARRLGRQRSRSSRGSASSTCAASRARAGARRCPSSRPARRSRRATPAAP